MVVGHDGNPYRSAPKPLFVRLVAARRQDQFQQYAERAVHMRDLRVEVKDKCPYNGRRPEREARQQPMNRTIAALVLFAIIPVAGCTKHEERYLTPWLKVDIRRPVTGSSGLVVVGSRDELFHSRVGDRWVRLGVGHSSTYMILGEDQAALIDLHDGEGLRLIRAGDPPRRVSEAFERRGDVSVLPGGEAIDVFECGVPAKPAGCSEVQISRYDVAGKLHSNFRVSLPEVYSDCQLMRIIGYDKERNPYVSAQCKWKSAQARCVLMAPRKDTPFVYAVGADRPATECGEFSRAGVSLTEPEHFVVLQ